MLYLSSIPSHTRSYRRIYSSRFREWIHKKDLDRTFSSRVDECVVNVPNSAPLRLSFGKLAKFADGNAVASMGDTTVLTTSVCKNKSSSGASSSAISSFVPLTVDYRQKAAAAGRIPTNFLRREVGTSEKEILTSRVIDRSIRPLFPKGFGLETQLVCNLLAVDGNYDPDVVAINASSASLALSDIPWNGPIGAVRVGCVGSKLIINPLRRDMAKSDLNLVLSGSADGKAVMLEADANNLDKALFLEGIECGLQSCAAIAKEIGALSQSVIKRELPPVLEIPAEVFRDMELMCSQKVRSVFYDTSHDKISRDKVNFKARDDAIATLKESYPGLDSSVFHECFNRICREQVAQMALEEGRRVDGRTSEMLRRITCEADLHPPLHGSALFQRGQTQVFCTVALDSIESALKADPVAVLTGALKEKNFFLHYEFPPYATNEIGRTGFGRRELGHGALAEKGLKAVIPKDFPFTIRLTSEVLESNGSSSMASVCGGSLALLDAGIPISESAAGVAIGLVTRMEGREVVDYVTLLDILGLEDYLGDMDFKVAGTRHGITALQADIKIPGLPFNVICNALEKGHKGICDILDIMSQCLSAPRSDKHNLPRSEVLHVPSHKRSRFVGPGGINLRRLTSETGVQVSAKDDGAWTIFAPNPEAMQEAKEVIQTLLEDDRVPEYEFGAIITVKVTEIKEKGVMVEMHPNMDPVLIHLSQLSASKVSSTKAVDLEVGQTMQVKYFGRDPETGAIRLSRKALVVANAAAVRMLNKSARSEPVSLESENLQLPEIQNRPFELKNRSVAGNSLRSRFYIDDLKGQQLPCQNSGEKGFPKKSLSTGDSYDTQFDEGYYHMDILLNKVMTARKELDESLERLQTARSKLKEIRSKYMFLTETSWTNRILAEGFKVNTFEKYLRQITKEKAIEETVRNNRRTHGELQNEFDRTKEIFLQKLRKSDLVEKPQINFKKSQLYFGTIKTVTGTGTYVLLTDWPTPIFIHHCLTKTNKNLIKDMQVTLQYLGKDGVTGRDLFIVVDNSSDNGQSEKLSDKSTSYLIERDTWSSYRYVKRAKTDKIDK